MSVQGPPPPPPRDADGRVRTDVVVVGSGVAGLYAAVNIPHGLDVVVVDKGRPGEDSGSSPWAQGGLGAALDPADSPRLHAEDTIIAGDGLCDPAAVDVLVHESPEHVRELLRLGVRFDRRDGASVGIGVDHADADGDPLAGLDLAREGGQRVGRSVKHADATGAELMRVLRQAASPRVARLPGIVVSLAKDPASGRVSGVWVLDDDGLVGVEARAVILATGGCGGLYAATTNPDGATGDALALAADAGAAVRDVEFVQFHPTGLATDGSWRFLLTEALRGAGATLHDADGRRFLEGRHPDAELAPRHVVAKAILELERGTAWLDATALGAGRLRNEFPTVLTGVQEHGYDLAGERVPVTPAAHYHVGGVRTDLHGRTSLPGLYAAGECASTGLHGANRLASNSLAEALVFGARTASAVARELVDGPVSLGPPPQLADPPVARDPALRDELRRAMLEGAGPTRDAARLDTLARWLALRRREHPSPAATREDAELHLALRAAALIVHGARLRTESRGGHWRDDYPKRDPRWSGVHLEQVGLPPLEV